MGRARKKTVVTIPPESIPNPWLADSEWLLTELARLREMVLNIPHRNENVLPINSVIDRCWRLEQQLRYLLSLHRAGQRAFAQKAEKTKPQKAEVVATPKSAVIRA